MIFSIRAQCSMRRCSGGIVEPVSRTSLSAVPGGRAAVDAAVGLEGAVVVTFFVAVQLLLNRHYFALSAAQYGAVYVPVFAAAVLAALLAVKGSRAAARGRVFRLGLTLTVVGRAAMIPTIVGAVRHAAVFFPDLVIIGALTGAGFALVHSAATAFALDIDPAQPERQSAPPHPHARRRDGRRPAAPDRLPRSWPMVGLSADRHGACRAADRCQLAIASGTGRRAKLRAEASSQARPRPGQGLHRWSRSSRPAAVVICVAWSQAGMIGSGDRPHRSQGARTRGFLGGTGMCSPALRSRPSTCTRPFAARRVSGCSSCLRSSR